MGTQKMHDEEYLDPQGAAKFTKRSKSTLDKLRCSGNGPRFIRAGRKILYKKADLVAWLDSKTFASTSEYLNGAR